LGEAWATLELKVKKLKVEKLKVVKLIVKRNTKRLIRLSIFNIKRLEVLHVFLNGTSLLN
jgi:hypothetical protein